MITLPRRWSKLQKALYNIIDPKVKLQIHCVAYPMRSKTGYANNNVPRYWITIEKEIIWDYPKIFHSRRVKKTILSLDGRYIQNILSDSRIY